MLDDRFPLITEKTRSMMLDERFPPVAEKTRESPKPESPCPIHEWDDLPSSLLAFLIQKYTSRLVSMTNKEGDYTNLTDDVIAGKYTTLNAVIHDLEELKP